MGIDIAQYEAPIKEAADKLKGNTGAASNASSTLGSLAGKLSDYSSAHRGDAAKLSGDWVGSRGDTFHIKAKEHTEALTSAADWADHTAKTIDKASTLVKAAEKQVTALLNEFESDAKTLISAAEHSKDPGAEQQARAVLAGMSAKYAKEAADVVKAAKSHLSEVVSGLGSTHASSTPSGGAIGGRSGGGAGGGSGGGGGGGGTGSAASTGPVHLTPPSHQYGSGTKIRLPGGKTSEAPNERAAIAVRAALSRLGLPYKWGGTDPKTGMDCSGLTQWAYGQAGVEIPRVANTQTVGQKVDVDHIQPGDLVIWSGHVAMYIGDGQMVEEPHTGAVCHVTPLRTDNAGEPFLGVFRPSEK